MKKINTPTILAIIISALIILFTIILHCLGKTKNPSSKPNEEVVLVNKQLLESHPWHEAAFSINCVDSINCDANNGYYWAIYNNPDAFDTILCVSMDKNTYFKLQSLIHKSHLSNYVEDNLSLEESRFHLYYGNCEETVLLWE